MKKNLLATLVGVACATSAMAWTSAPASRADVTAAGLQPSQYEIGPGARRAAAEDGSYEYSVAVNPAEPMNCYSFNNAKSGYLYLAFGISADEVAQLAGDKIKAVNITTGTLGGSSSSQGISSGTIFISRDLETFAARQSAKFEKTALTVNSFELEEPFEISGDEPIYIGYIFKVASTNGYYAAVDEVLAPLNGTLVGVTTKVSQFPASFSDYTDQIGSLCISATIEGTHSPMNQAQIISSSIPATAIVGQPYSYDITILNRGNNEISSLEVGSNIAGLEESIFSYEFSDPLPAGKMATISVNIPPFEAPVVDVLSSTVKKVNGVDNTYSSLASGYISCFTEGFPRKVVCEEATGTWCGWCPAGIVMMERLKEVYPDDVIRIAVHQGDRMQVSNYMGFISEYVSGFPTAWFNRTEEIGPTASGVDQLVDNFVKKTIAAPSYISVKADGVAGDKILNASAKVKFSVGTTAPHLLSFVVVEDGVGPYDQSNYFAVGKQGHSMPMGEWNDRTDPYKTIYDDVARNIQGYPGIEGALPLVIEEGEEYEYSLEMAISNVVSDTFRLVALVVNGNTGEIMNADEVVVSKMTGVDGISEETAPVVTVADRVISVEGASEVAVYSIDGARVSTKAVTAVPSGVYVVVADGRASKVAVR